MIPATKLSGNINRSRMCDMLQMTNLHDSLRLSQSLREQGLVRSPRPPARPARALLWAHSILSLTWRHKDVDMTRGLEQRRWNLISTSTVCYSHVVLDRQPRHLVAHVSIANRLTMLLRFTSCTYTQQNSRVMAVIHIDMRVKRRSAQYVCTFPGKSEMLAVFVANYCALLSMDVFYCYDSSGGDEMRVSMRVVGRYKHQQIGPGAYLRFSPNG